MTNFFKKKSGSKRSPDQDTEQTFSILPHPAKTNNPADLLPQPEHQPGGGLANAKDPATLVHNSAPGPVIPDDEIRKNIEALGAPTSREENRARAAELNSKSNQ